MDDPSGTPLLATFLNRLDTLGLPTRSADQAALETLANRGITAEERQRLRTLIEKAKTLPDLPVNLPAFEKALAAEHQNYQEILLQLYLWHSDWSQVARTFIKRRDYLVNLGLAKRKPTENLPISSSMPSETQ